MFQFVWLHLKNIMPDGSNNVVKFEVRLPTKCLFTFYIIHDTFLFPFISETKGL